jgi:hypothetical protein
MHGYRKGLGPNSIWLSLPTYFEVSEWGNTEESPPFEPPAERDSAPYDTASRLTLTSVS